MQLCKTISFCPLLLALLDLTDAELRKSDEFNIIRNFRFLHARSLEERITSGTVPNIFKYIIIISDKNL